MEINLIGAGNVATHMGLALRKAGHTICGVFSRAQASADVLTGLIGGIPVTDVGLLPEADLHLFAVKDDAIRPLALRLTGRRPNAMLVHTAGSVPMSVFADLTIHYGVIYPLQTFSKSAPITFHEVPCFVEANEAETLLKLRHLAESISGKVQVLDSEHRARLHLAAVFANNFANHCYAIASQILRQSGLDERLLHPLIQETANKVLHNEARSVQTGPAVRYDRSILQKQSAMLAQDPLLRQIYEAMSQSIHNYAQQLSH